MRRVVKMDQYAKGHKYLTLVYQIDIGVTRLLRVGKERAIESFQGFFTIMGKAIVSKIVTPNRDLLIFSTSSSGMKSFWRVLNESPCISAFGSSALYVIRKCSDRDVGVYRDHY